MWCLCLLLGEKIKKYIYKKAYNWEVHLVLNAWLLEALALLVTMKRHAMKVRSPGLHALSWTGIQVTEAKRISWTMTFSIYKGSQPIFFPNRFCLSPLEHASPIWAATFSGAFFWVFSRIGVCAHAFSCKWIFAHMRCKSLSIKKCRFFFFFFNLTMYGACLHAWVHRHIVINGCILAQKTKKQKPHWSFSRGLKLWNCDQ